MVSNPRQNTTGSSGISKIKSRRVSRGSVMYPRYGKGMIFGGRWFEHIETREIWRLAAPDFPFRGLWERVIRSVS